MDLDGVRGTKMKRNHNIEFKKRINETLDEVKKLLVKAMGEAEKVSLKDEVYERRSEFLCDGCKKTIPLDKPFVSINIFENMNRWYNDYFGWKSNVYCIKCYNEMIKNAK